ncbi:hypothetical protein CISIN_1g029835mg [Citrus sinensis]|uniref:CNNM transmembrane domain-containing protein n=1 Tax=Citrus sinensis TaxID=2711 RepID=A0A067DBL4_CITSI|nr:hypothetical protein CISIN_1g029835mg [Citrus sinensis]
MDFALESAILKRPILISGLKISFSIPQYRSSNFPVRLSPKGGIALGALACVVLVVGCQRVFAVESTVNAGYGVIGQSILLLKSSWPKLSQVLRVFKEQGLILAALLGLSAFFSMAETSITTLWPWKVYYLIVYV